MMCQVHGSLNINDILLITCFRWWKTFVELNIAKINL